MEIIISSNNSKPIYEQITSQIKAKIMSGELAAGQPIPSMRALAKAIHVSVITVQKAYEAVSYTHLDVYKRQGQHPDTAHGLRKDGGQRRTTGSHAQGKDKDGI